MTGLFRYLPVLFIAYIVLCLNLTVSAQSTDEYSISETGRAILEENEAETEESDLLSELEEAASDSLNINEAGMEELTSFPFIDHHSAAMILNYRKKNGHIFSKNELMMIDSLDRQVIRKLLPFITVKKKTQAPSLTMSLPAPVTSLRLRSVTSYSDPEKSGTGNYPGSRIKFYSRLKTVLGDNVSASILTEKDAYEKSMLDFTSFFIQAKLRKPEAQLLIGDFKLRSGLGLILSSAFTLNSRNLLFTKSAPGKNTLLPFSGTAENRFFRGIAFSASASSLQALLFYSSNALDALIDRQSGIIQSLPEEGNHRSSSEINKKDMAKAQAFGFLSGWKPGKVFSFDLLFLREKFNLPLLYTLQNSTRNEFTTVSVSYRAATEKINLSGETARQQSRTMTLNVLRFRVNRFISTATSFRYYSGGFHLLYGSPYTRTTPGKYPETGFLSGINANTSMGKFSLLYEIFSFPGGSPFSSFSVSGKDFILYYQLSGKDFSLSLGYKHGILSGLEESENEVSLRSSNSVKLSGALEVNRQITVKPGMELKYRSDERGKTKSGYRIYSVISYHYLKKISLIFSGAYYNTQSLGEVLFHYESDLEGMSGTTALSGEGFSYSFLGKLSISQLLLLQARYSVKIEDKRGEEAGDRELLPITGRTDTISLLAEIRF